VVLGIVKSPVRKDGPNRMRGLVDCTGAEATAPPIQRVGCRIGATDGKGAATRKAEA
jgi:hypothetical protein